MKSAKPKVLHEIAGLPMVAHVVAAARGRRRRRSGAGRRPWRRRGAQGGADIRPQAEIFVQDRAARHRLMPCSRRATAIAARL